MPISGHPVVRTHQIASIDRAALPQIGLHRLKLQWPGRLADAKPQHRGLTWSRQPAAVEWNVSHAGATRIKKPAAGSGIACVDTVSQVIRWRAGKQFEGVARAPRNLTLDAAQLGTQVIVYRSGAQCAQHGFDSGQFGLTLHCAPFVHKVQDQRRNEDRQQAPFENARRVPDRSPLSKHVQPVRPMAACPMLHNGRKTPSARISTSTAITVNNKGSIADDSPLML